MDGVTITANQWNKLQQLVVNVPLIYLLDLNGSQWPNNCKITCRVYYGNKLKEIVDKVMRCRFYNE
jgi:hypothetical protein